MTAMASLPTWAVYAVAFGTPLSALAGVLIGQFLSRAGAKELEQRSRREETLRNLRWASELAVDDDPARADLGVVQLKALLDSDLLDETETVFVDATLNLLVEGPVAALESLGVDSATVRVEDDANAETAFRGPTYDDDKPSGERS